MNLNVPPIALIIAHNKQKKGGGDCIPNQHETELIITWKAKVLPLRDERAKQIFLYVTDSL